MLNESASDTSIQPYDRENMIRRVAVHEAAHAVAYVLACRALGLNGHKFVGVQIRRDLSKPLLGRYGDELEGWGGLFSFTSLHALRVLRGPLGGGS